MATIKAIESQAIHRIQSGQVITDLCSVAKELVENSLDAGATSIDVRFKNNGLDCIEVSDNGKGISSADFESLALKHYTSKLSSYDDLTSLETFGFRGEALSSLCALSHLHIITARSNAGAKGTRLDFEASGKLKSTSVVAAPRGTTVVVDSLFHNLPVRQKELERHIKREYAKVLGALQSYACIATGVKFQISNQMPKGKRNPVFATKANPTTRDNITNVFGAKTALALLKLDLELDMQPTSALPIPGNHGQSPQGAESSQQAIVQGHISRPGYGEGRQAPDRQMFFVNSRPCGLPQIAKAFNEVYKSYNVTQSPFVFANLIIDTNAYDVNVSPDKRTILLHDQPALLESLKEALNQLFEAHAPSIPVSQLINGRLPAYKSVHSSGNQDGQDRVGASSSLASSPVPPNLDLTSSPPDNEDTDIAPSARVHDTDITMKDYSSPPESVESQHDTIETPHSLSRPDQINALKLLGSQRATPGPVESAFNRMRPKRVPAEIAHVNIGGQTSSMLIDRVGRPQKSTLNKQISSKTSLFASSLRGFAAPGTHSEIGYRDDDGVVADEITDDDTPAVDCDIDTNLTSEPESDVESRSIQSTGDSESIATPQPITTADSDEADIDMSQIPVHSDDAESKGDTPHADDEVADNLDKDADASDGDYLDEEAKKIREDRKIAEMIQKAELEAARPSEENLRRAERVLKIRRARLESTHNLELTLETSMSSVEKTEMLINKVRQDDRSGPNRHVPVVEAVSETDTADAEARLSLSISKADFLQMRIIGQFNLGFIIAYRRAPDPDTGIGNKDDQVFIIDQHAADEKYNFERLTRTTILQPQRLVQAKALELSARDEEILASNPQTLELNGFQIHTDETGTQFTGQRCKLVALPTSKETTFSISDLEELIHLLGEAASESQQHVFRPSRVRRMLAMRACRSSIMVGKTLTRKQMTRVVRHMGRMEKPWNCPHGRPTMRHLAGLEAWESWREGAGTGAAIGRSTDWDAYLGERCKNS